jgi:curved DNA-binding protein CbpA
MAISKLERLACYALAVQVYFASPALSFLSHPSVLTCPRSQATAPHMSSDSNPPPFFNASSLPPPEELPDDVPKDVSNENLENAINNKEKTLYEILGASPTATRAELKTKYIEMAKLSHPDAQIGRMGAQVETLDFGEIAAAWRVLGDAKSRKRYDRELQYKEWSAYASKYANEKLEEAVPAMAKMMDNVAVPFIRRTAATTIAMSQAVSKIGRAAKGSSSTDPSNSAQGKDSGGNSLTDAFLNAIKAGREAGRAIDSLELNEKSKELADR